MRIHGVGIPRPASANTAAATATSAASTSDGARSRSPGIGATLPAFTKLLHGDDLDHTPSGETRRPGDSVLSAPHDSTRRARSVLGPVPAPAQAMWTVGCAVAP